jgi:hypothetical protein
MEEEFRDGPDSWSVFSKRASPIAVDGKTNQRGAGKRKFRNTVAQPWAGGRGGYIKSACRLSRTLITLGITAEAFPLVVGDDRRRSLCVTFVRFRPRLR